MNSALTRPSSNWALFLAAILSPAALAQPGRSFTPSIKGGHPSVIQSARLLVKPISMIGLGRTDQQEEPSSPQHALSIARLAPFSPRAIGPLDLYVIETSLSTLESTRASLIATGDYEYVERDEFVLPVGAAASSMGDPLAPNEWHLAKIRADQAWGTTNGTTSIIVAALDTGVDQTHPELTANLISGYNAVDRIAQSAGGHVNDVNGHGTTTAGVIAAAGDNGIGVAGICWHVPFMPIRVSNSAGGGAFMSDIIAGGIWAIQHGAKVLYAPYAGVQSPGSQTLGQWAKLNNALLVWSADNAGMQYSAFEWPDVLIVAGTDSNDHLASFSNYGQAIDLAAPAKDIYTTTRGGTYAMVSGNSYASPIVAGVIALAWGLDPSLSASRMQEILLDSCDSLDNAGRFGAGRVNAARTVRGNSRADFNRDGTIDLFDADEFIVAFESHDPSSDIDMDGQLDFFDYDAFMALFEDSAPI